MIYKALRATSVLIALLMVMTLGLPGANAEEVERDDAVGLSSRYTNEVKSSALIWKAGLLPGELQHESTLASLIDIAAEDLSTSRAMAPADLAAYTVITGDESIELVPTSEVEQQDVAAIAHVPNMYGYTITTNDLREIGNPLYKKASCYRKKSWNSATMRHDICYWKYRIDEESGSYDYWLYGNELVSTVTRTHRGVPDPYVKYAKVAQQLGYSERTNYMTFGRYDTVKTHAPRGSHYGNCQTIDISSSISAEKSGVGGTVGISAPLEICSRITEYINQGNTYKRATYVHEDNLWGSNRRKTAAIVSQTIIKLKQRPYGSWQPYWSDTAETKIGCWQQWPCRDYTFK